MKNHPQREKILKEVKKLSDFYLGFIEGTLRAYYGPYLMRGQMHHSPEEIYLKEGERRFKEFEKSLDKILDQK